MWINFDKFHYEILMDFPSGVKTEIKNKIMFI